MKTRSAFTLIELLVVVSVLAILAAIATINFLEAQARSKVSRVENDMRTIAGALEVYRLDNELYPPAAIRDYQFLEPLTAITTPIAYLNNVPRDPFGRAQYDFNPGFFDEGYKYKDKVSTSQGMPAETYGHIWEELPDKEYFLHSCGPNKVWDVTPYVDYDPTNGTVSLGDITRFGPM